MEENNLLGWKKNGSNWLMSLEEDEEEMKGGLPSVPQPQTPMEPMDFLSRSWSLSASEISKALAKKQKHFTFDKNISVIPEIVSPPQVLPGGTKTFDLQNRRRTGAIGRWFHNKDSNNKTVKKKDKARLEMAHMHAVLSVAGLAAALAAVAAAESSKGSSSKMSMALTSATELLASHCLEMAESAGADHDRVTSVVRSAVDIHTASDLVTLTAAAATALRGEAALKSRLPKEARRNAAISPCDKSMVEAQSFAAFSNEMDEHDSPFVGELLQITRKGVQLSKRVSVYVNKKSQVVIKLKSKHVGGAFSKNNKCVVYEICDESEAWPFQKETESLSLYLGIKTAQGLLEFKCKNKSHKQKWVNGIQNLLYQASSIEDTEDSLRMLNINNSI